jgi:uncharacterized protein
MKTLVNKGRTFSSLLHLTAALLFLFVSTAAISQEDVPAKPMPARLYNNISKSYPELLSASDAGKLEKKLEEFAKSTSNQIIVVIADDLGGYEPWEYAAKIGDKWGVGQENEDNGVVILVKPTKENGGRQTFIAPGRGLEGAIPDLTCRQIVNNELIPHFKNNDYAAGINAAVDVLMALAKNEYNSAEYAKRNKKDNIGAVVVVIVIIIIIVVIFGRRGGGGRGGFTSRGYYGGWGGFGGFGGGFGGGSSGGGGGFGGFGGGSFGGGGSGGSW